MKEEELRARIAALRSELAHLEASLKRLEDEAWIRWQRDRKAAMGEYDSRKPFEADYW